MLRLDYKQMLLDNEQMLIAAHEGDTRLNKADLMTARGMIKDCYIAELEQRIEALEAAVAPKKKKAA